MTHPLLNPLFSMKSAKSHWKRFLSLGVALIVLGFFATSAAVATSFVTLLFVATTLLLGGLTKLTYSFWAKHLTSFLLSLLSGLLYTLMGVLFIAKPFAGLAALTLLLGGMFLVSGIFKITLALKSRPAQWEWSFLSGIISSLLGIMVLSEWPEASVWILGLFVGVDLIFYGWTVVLLSLAAKNEREEQKSFSE